MSEAVEILIKADDQASQKFATVAANMDKAGQKAGNTFKKMGGQAKVTLEFVGNLANMTGNSQIESLASMLAKVTDKASKYSTVAKAAGGGSLAFKLGLVGLAATAGFMVGKVLGDLIFQTAKFEREMKNAKEEAKELDEQVKKLQSTIFSNQMGDIELIRDPEAKRAAHKKLLADLNRDIQTAGDVVGKSKREVEEWAEAWKITGNQKQFEQDAIAQLAIDKERLKTLKEQRDEIIKIVGARATEVAEIKAGNEAKDESEAFLKTLRDEVELLKATREEQIKIEAARNTVAEDRGEAESLLKDRDALKKKIETEKELEDTKRKTAEEAEQARQKTIDDAAKEKQLVTDLIASEEERLELQRIELELGKEAAKVQALVNQGVDKETALRLAAEETAIEELSKQKDKEGEEPAVLQASQSRLLTRGQQSSPMDQTNKLLELANKHAEQLRTFNKQQLEQQKLIAQNTASTLTVKPTT